jgi:transposase
VAKGTGLTRGDQRRNDRIAVLRAVVRRDRVILSIDLGEDRQVAALMDHEGRVLGRRKVTAKAYALADLLVWAQRRAAVEGFAGLVVACEPTGHRWRAVMGLADEVGAGFVCVQSLRVHLARQADDYTRDKTDHKDAVLIGVLTARLECYLPERASADWARLRHLGQRRRRLIVEQTRCRAQVGDLLSCSFPAALECAAKPFESNTWLACLAVTVSMCDGDADLAAVRHTGRDQFTLAVRDRLGRFGGRRLAHTIVNRFWTALADPAGVPAQRPGALERVGFGLDDWNTIRTGLSDVEQRMVGILDAMGLTRLVTSVPGLSATGAAAILAETGDLSRFASPRSVVKHAGLAPAENTSATLRGQTRVSGRGRPGLRLAAWRAVWPGLVHNQVLADRFAHLTSRDSNRLSAGQSRVACAATLLRWLYAIITSRQPWNAHIAAGQSGPRHRPAVAA